VLELRADLRTGRQSDVSGRELSYQPLGLQANSRYVHTSIGPPRKKPSSMMRDSKRQMFGQENILS